jgi:hypothetical protein
LPEIDEIEISESLAIMGRWAELGALVLSALSVGSA